MSEAVDEGGLVGIILFYIGIFSVGIFASWKSNSWKPKSSEDVMLAGREVGLLLGVFTMTATWVGGGYINGTAEVVFNPEGGLVWCQAPVGYAISLFLGGLIFAKKMHEERYVTMLDPLQAKYGRLVAVLLYLPALFGDIFWTSAILSALGCSLSVIKGVEHSWAVIASAGISILYTILGGLYSVVYTDVVQLFCIFVGLWLCVPFALANDAVTSISSTAFGKDGWLGTSNLHTNKHLGSYIDNGLLLVFGGIPWQAYFQRVVSQKTAKGAQLLSFLAAGSCMIMAVPAVLIGAIGHSTDWNITGHRESGEILQEPENYKRVLPMVLQYLTPLPVAVIGFGAVSAAVMSSADSSLLSSSTMFAWNVYKPIRNAISSCCCCCTEASEEEILWVMRISLFLIGGAATALAAIVDSIYGLWYLCSDLIYVILFPQLLCCIHMPFTNTYGSMVGIILGLFFRLTGGEYFLDFPPLIKYPLYDEATSNQCFPYKTLAMLISLASIILGSLMAKLIFKWRLLPPQADIAKSFLHTLEEYESEELQEIPEGTIGTFTNRSVSVCAISNQGFT